MADVITRLKVDSSEYDSKIKRATQGLQSLEDSLHKAGKSFADADAEQVEFARQLGQMETVSRSVRGKINELTQSYTELSVQYKQMSDEEKASPFGKALSASLDQLKGRIGDTKNQLKEVDSELGNTKQSSNELGGVVGMLASKFGVSAEVLTTFGAVVGGVTIAVKVARDAFMMSEGNIDEWGRTVEGAKGAYESFLASLNSDSWGNFFGNIEKAVTGARDLYDAMDRLNSVKSNNAAAIAYWRSEVQRLRLEKQNGGDVDLLLKSAEGNLRSLQSQGIQAGKVAGRQQITQTLTTAYNQQTGANGGLSASKQKEIADKMLMYGQSYFDEQKKLRDQLAKKAEASIPTLFGEQRYVNLNKLNDAEREQYLVANAVTEAETRLQKGINQYAQALGEEAAASREQFRTNRYVLQGSGGGGRTGGGGGARVAGSAWAPIAMGAFTPINLFSRSIKDVQGDLASAQQQYNEAGDAIGRAAAMAMVEKYQHELEAMKMEGSPFADAYSHDFNKDMERLSRDLPEREGKTKFSDELGKFNKEFSTISGGVNSIASGIQQLGVDLPEGFNQTLSAMQGISTILTGILALTTLINADTKVQAAASFVDAFTPFATGGVVRAASGWSGVVPGSRFSGDNIPALLDSQELVLNAAQTGRVASALQSSTNRGGGAGTPYVDGEKIFLGLNNYLRRSGKGEIVTAR